MYRTFVKHTPYKEKQKGVKLDIGGKGTTNDKAVHFPKIVPFNKTRPVPLLLVYFG